MRLVGQLPLVLFGTSFVFDVASIYAGPALVEAALFDLALGIVAMVAAALLELVRYFRQLPPGSSVRRLARWRFYVDAVALALFVVSLARRWPVRGIATTPRLPFVLSALGLAVLGVATWIGGLADWQWDATRRRRSPGAR